MRQAMDWVCTGLNVRHAALLMQDGPLHEPHIQVGLGWMPGWVGRTVQQRSRHFASEMRLSLPDEMQKAHGLRSLLAVPSETGPEQDFSLVAASTEDRPFSDADKDFLRSLAHVLSAALERHRSRERLTYLARFDGLTGLPNRSLLFDRLERILNVARGQGTRVALLYMDLDHFKLVNDNEHLADACYAIKAGLRSAEFKSALAMFRAAHSAA